MKLKSLLHRIRQAARITKKNIKNFISYLDSLDQPEEADSAIKESKPPSVEIRIDPSEILDLEPIESFLEDYIGGLIVDLVDVKNIDNLGFSEPKIVSSVYIEGTSCKFELSDVSGQGTSYLTILPTKFGTFVEKESEEKFETSSRYRISFYGGFCLEYLDSKGLGEMIYEE